MTSCGICGGALGHGPVTAGKELLCWHCGWYAYRVDTALYQKRRRLGWEQTIRKGGLTKEAANALIDEIQSPLP